MEPRLAAREACQRFVVLFAAYAPSGDSEPLSRLLKPFLRILLHSKRITVSYCRHPLCYSLQLYCMAVLRRIRLRAGVI